MSMPELPTELQELIMSDWYTALWQRMHKRRAQESGHLYWFASEMSCLPWFVGWWEESYEHYLDNAAELHRKGYLSKYVSAKDARMWVVEEPQLPLHVLMLEHGVCYKVLTKMMMQSSGEAS